MKAKDILSAIAETLHGQAVELALDACEAAAHAARVESLAHICDEESANKIVDLFVKSNLIRLDGDCVVLTVDEPSEFTMTAKGGVS